MSYNEYQIKEIVEKIGKNDVYLPAIQRKFVWHYEQIESLFDSILRGYPIGTFLFWFVRGDDKNNYTFYKFIQEYHERDKYLNEIAPKPELKEEIIGVLDGQQRLSSMYIALQGSYAYKKPYARWESDNAFPKRKLYLNLFKEDVEKEDENFVYEFKFLADAEAKKIDETHLWFLVRDVLLWGRDPKIDEYYDNLLEKTVLSHEIKEIAKQKRDLIKRTLRILHQRLVIEKLISYYKVEKPEEELEEKPEEERDFLDTILDIFVRVNSGGTVLSKSDLLFSTIVANWEHAREEIETLLQTINKKGDGFRFDNDFVMRACLVLTDSPVLFKVKSFKKENIDKIMKEWDSIKTSVERTIELLVEFGFSGENLTSLNAVIPIAYYFMKGGKTDDTSKNEIRKYIVYALLKQTFGGQGDQVLSNIRESMRKTVSGGHALKRESFSLKELMDTTKLPGNRTLKITDNDIEEILEYTKGPYTFMALSFLYPNLRFGQVKFHQDHIHPASSFTDAKLKTFGIPENKWKNWQVMKEQLPNLQLMEGLENESKNKTPFKDWLDGKDGKGNPNVSDRAKFINDNYIAPTISLEFKDFEVFFNKRKEILRKKIREVLS
ncbi:MAG: DUF262 domain-containing protein [Acidobacteria bacterium]|nr:DUF262 domain-containing protein [Acidobacteriota bacterium]MBU4307346.1 DUF262 domain-containing protein [Acidobacteriota bacterium]MCG2810503.1 DUF262 domain-containing protein [Candidatus Aminicenantes bacterium]